MSHEGGRDERKQNLLATFKVEVARDVLFSSQLTFALFSVSSFMQVKQSTMGMILNCSTPMSIGEFKNFHGICILCVASLCCQLMINFTRKDDLHINKISKGVATLETYSILPYHSSNDFSLLIYQFFEFSCIGISFYFTGIDVVHVLPDFMSKFFSKFILTPIESTTFF